MSNRNSPSDLPEENTLRSVKSMVAGFEALKHIKVDLPAGELAYWTAPRRSGEWRLARDSDSLAHSDSLLMLSMRDDYYKPNAYLAVIPQPIIMHQKVGAVLEDYARRLFEHFPKENSLARREHGVPMLIGRFDVIVDQSGDVQICELDDVCSLWAAMSQMNPIVDSYLHVLEDQLKMPIYAAELFQYADGAFAASPRVRKEYARISFYDDSGEEQVAFIPRDTTLKMAILEQNGLGWRDSQNNTDRGTAYYEQILRRFYAHNEDHWRGDINEAWLLKGKRFGLDDVALSVRAYRDMPEFKEHMDRYGPRSISMAWERDSKWPLIPERLGVLADNLDVAVKFGQRWQLDHPDQFLAFKALRSARTEHVAIYSSRGTKPKGISSATQIARKFGDAANKPIVVQPYKEPDSLHKAGVEFLDLDRPAIRARDHVGTNPGERIVPGMEGRFPMIFRSFVVYLPREKRLVHVGGMWQATDGRIIHGGSHSVSGPLYVDGVVGHPSGERSATVTDAEKFVRRYGKVLASAPVVDAISITSPPIPRVK